MERELIRMMEKNMTHYDQNNQNIFFPSIKYIKQKYFSVLSKDPYYCIMLPNIFIQLFFCQYFFSESFSEFLLARAEAITYFNFDVKC
jgi:hypothetical protein